MKKQFTFPPTAEFMRVVKRSEESDQRTNFLLPPNATDLEKAKYKLCKNILRYKHQLELSTEIMAQRLGLSVSEVEKILFSRIDELQLDELIRHANNLSFRVKIDSFYDESKDSPKAH